MMNHNFSLGAAIKLSRHAFGRLNRVLARTMIGLLVMAMQGLAQSTYEPYTFTTLAGSSNSGYADGTGSAAGFAGTSGVAVDSGGNIYVADANAIRKVTPAGVVTTLAGVLYNPGSADGTGSAAQFNQPAGVAVDSAGNVYVADREAETIRKVTPAGVVTTLAGLAGSRGSVDGMGSEARFGTPSGLAVDSAGNVYVAESSYCTIRKVTPMGGVTTLAGQAGKYGSADGTGSEARFSQPTGVAVDSTGDVYVADRYTIRKGYAQSMFAPFLLSGPVFGSQDGQFGFSLTGPAGQSVVVEVSTDLLSWQPIWTNTFTGALIFSDPQSGGNSNRFYRAHTP